MIRCGLALTGFLRRNPYGSNSHDASLYGAIGISLFAHILIFTTLGIVLTPNIQALAGKPLFSDIVAILEYQDTVAEHSRTPIAALIAPAKLKEPAKATPQLQRNNIAKKTKMAQQLKKTPKADSAKLDTNTNATLSINDNAPEENLHAQAIDADRDLKPSGPPAVSETEVPPDHDTMSEYPPDHLAATANFRTQLLVDDLKTHAPRYNAPGLTNPRPKYPRLARNKGYTGEVLLKVHVSKLGTAATVSVAQSSGYALLDRSALRTIKTWRFLPAERGGSVVDEEILVPVSFRLIN